MFASKNIAVQLAGARFNLVDDADDDSQKLTIIEANLVIEPWPFELLRELGEDAVGHVFLADGRVKPELRSVKIRPTYGRLQRFQFSPALDAKVDASIEPVIVEYFKFDRRESEKRGAVWAKGTIRINMEYRDKAVRDLLSKRFGQRVFLSTIGLEGRLNFEAPAADPKPEAETGTLLTFGRAPEPDPAAGDVLEDKTRHGRKSDPDVH